MKRIVFALFFILLLPVSTIATGPSNMVVDYKTCFDKF